MTFKTCAVAAGLLCAAIWPALATSAQTDSSITVSASPAPTAKAARMPVAPLPASRANGKVTVPGAPTDVVAHAGDGSATVSFNPPIDNGGSEITGYTVASMPAGGEDFDAGINRPSHYITGLTNGIAYTFTVVATNSRGNGPASLPSNSVTPQPYGTFPATARGTRSAVIPFTIHYPTFPPVTLTSVTVDPDDFAITESNCIPTPPGSCTIRVAFAPKPDTGLGVVNGSLDVVADLGSLSTPMSGSAVAYSMSANPEGLAFAETAAGDNSANLAITLTNNSTGTAAIEGVQIAGVDFEQFSVVSSNCITLLSSGASCLTTVRFTPASAGSKSAKLRFSHAWTNFDIDLAGTGTGVSLPPPDAPTNAMAVAGDNKATVSFTPPENVGGGAITGYTVTSFPAGGVDSHAGSTATSHLITGLSNGTSYTFTVVARNGFGTGPASTASNPIIPFPSLSIGDVLVMEGGPGLSTASFTVSLSQAAAAPVTFDIATSNGTAEASSDYVALGLAGESIAPGQTSKIFTVTINGDTVQEAEETFYLTLGNVTGATLLDGTAMGTIVDDDAPALSISDVSIVEGNSGTRTAIFSLSLSKMASTDVSYNIATANDTANLGDYMAKSQNGQVIPAGATGATFPVNIKGDTQVELDETFYANISAVSGAGLSDSQGMATIVNDDGVQLSIADVSVSEGDTGTKTATITVALDPVASVPVTFDLATADYDATAGSDYQPFNLTGQSIAAGQASKTFDVVINGDTVRENDEAFLVTASNVTGAALADGQGEIIILNDDLPTLSVSDYTLTEGDSGTRSAIFTVSLSPPVSTQVSYSIATADGTATAGSDYVGASLDNQILVPGQPSRTFTVTVNGDTALDGTETFFVNLSNPVGATIADGQGIGTIMNDDSVSLTISGSPIYEGSSGTHTAAFTVNLSKPAPGPVTFDLATADILASAGSDYIALSLPGLVIPAGQTSLGFEVPIIGDTIIEPNETFTINVSNATGVTSSQGQLTATIMNDDFALLSIADASIAEGDGGTKTLAFAVSLDQPADVGFRVTTVAGTATAESDYVAKDLVFHGNVATVNVTIKGDTVVEGDETFTVVLSQVTGAEVVDGIATGTILNDDTPPSLSISDISVLEGNAGYKAASFSISLTSPAQPGGTSFDVATEGLRGVGDAATAGSDYVAAGPVRMVISEGESTANFNVKLLGDTKREADEVFGVRVNGVIGAAVAKDMGRGTIVNDDAMRVSSVQGDGMTSPITRQQASVQGVVTALTRDGLFMQSAADDEDGNPGTSEGLFVRADAGMVPDVSIGQRVEARGLVREAIAAKSPLALSRTELVASDVTLVAKAQPLPSPVVLDATEMRVRGGTSGLERYEGMRVAVPRLTVVGPVGGSINETSGLSSADGVFYGVPAGLARPFLEPGRHLLEASASRNEALPVFDGNPERLRIDSAGQRGAKLFAADVGDNVTGLLGVLDDGTGSYSLLPDVAAGLKVHAGANPRPVTAPLASESLIGYLPLHRFFDADNDPRHDEPVMSPDAYALRLAKTAHVLCAYMRSPAIVAVTGIENLSALSDLAEASNSQAGNVLFPAGCEAKARYRPIMLEGNDGQGLNIGLLVDSANVQAGVAKAEVISVQALAKAEIFTTVDGGSSPLFEQPPLLLQARIHRVADKPLTTTVLLTHLGDNETVPAASRDDEQLRSKRRAQAQYLARYIQSRQVRLPSENLVVLGGFGASEFSDGRDDLMGLLAGTSNQPKTRGNGPAENAGKPLLNLTLGMPTHERYSIVSEGNAQALDHVLVSQPLANKHRLRCEFARINADFGIDHADDFGLPMRISKSDPMVLFIGSR